MTHWGDLGLVPMTIDRWVDQELGRGTISPEQNRCSILGVELAQMAVYQPGQGNLEQESDDGMGESSESGIVQLNGTLAHRFHPE